jgi:hypothetical protein
MFTYLYQNSRLAIKGIGWVLTFVVLIIGVACGVRPVNDAGLSVIATPSASVVATPAYPVVESGPCASPVKGVVTLGTDDPPMYASVITDTAGIPFKNPSLGLDHGETFSLDQIDYTRDIVLTIEWGAHPSCRYGLHVESINVSPPAIHLSVTNVRPVPGTDREAMEASAYAFIMLPRSILDPQQPVDVTVTDETGKRYTWQLAMR